MPSRPRRGRWSFTGREVLGVAMPTTESAVRSYIVSRISRQRDPVPPLCAGRTSALQSNVTAWKTGRNKLVLTPVQRSPAKKAIKGPFIAPGAEVADVDVNSEQPAALCNLKHTK